MRESIGGAQVLMIIITILIVMIVLLTASISYTKAFKGRNAIINIIEKYSVKGDTATDIDEKAKSEINDVFKDMGYMINTTSTKTCEDKRPKDKYKWEDCTNGDQYNYSIYHYVVYEDNKYGEKQFVAEYYGVLTYMYFEIPLFGRNDRFVFPIYGETASLRGVDDSSFRKNE